MPFKPEVKLPEPDGWLPNGLVFETREEAEASAAATASEAGDAFLSRLPNTARTWGGALIVSDDFILVVCVAIAASGLTVVPLQHSEG